MAAKKKKKAGASAKAGATKKKKASKAVKAKKSPAKKSTRRPAKATKKAVTKKSKKKVVKAAARKAPARKAKKPAKKTVGEGDYAASRKFDKDQAGFVAKNKASIPDMGKAAEAALDGPQGDLLREAEATAAARSRDTF